MDDQDSWEAATWEGARREQLRRTLKLSVRERLEALEALSETSERLLQGKRRRSGNRSDCRSDRKPG